MDSNYRKKIILSFLFTFVFASCGSRAPSEAVDPGGPSQNLSSVDSSSTLWRYHLGDGCNSGERLFKNEEDLCLNLQIKENNASCTENSLKANFNILCPGRLWDLGLARHSVFNSEGLLLHCVFSEDMHDSRRALQQFTRKGYAYFYFLNKTYGVEVQDSKLLLTVTDKASNVVLSQLISPLSQTGDPSFDLSSEVQTLNPNLSLYCTEHEGPIR